LGIFIFCIGFFLGAVTVFTIMAVAWLQKCDQRKDWWEEDDND
jgi:hypothetical protein